MRIVTLETVLDESASYGSNECFLSLEDSNKIIRAANSLNSKGKPFIVRCKRSGLKSYYQFYYPVGTINSVNTWWKLIGNEVTFIIVNRRSGNLTGYWKA